MNIYMLVGSCMLFVCAFVFYETGKKLKRQNTVLKTGEKTMYHIFPYILAILSVFVGLLALLFGVIS